MFHSRVKNNRERTTKSGSGSSSSEGIESTVEPAPEMRTERVSAITSRISDRSRNLWRPGITRDNEERRNVAVAVNAGLTNRYYRASTERTRKTSEPESDDENFIQSLQISDASSDEEDEIPPSAERKFPFAKQQNQQQEYTKKSNDAIDFGKGIWRDMDLGQLPAFSFRNGREPDLTHHMTSTQQARMLNETALPPTKMAYKVNSKVPQSLNGLSRVYSPSRFLSHRRDIPIQSYARESEYLPHHEVPHYETRDNRALETRLPQTHSDGSNIEHRCGGCYKERPYRGEEGTHTRKLLASILRKSFPRNSNSR